MLTDRERRMLRGRPSLLVGLGPKAVFVMTIGLILTNVARAVDYFVLYGAEWERVRDLTLVEKAAPLWCWGIALCIGSLFVLVGSLDPPRLRTLVAGHVMLFLTNGMIGVGSIIHKIFDGEPGGWRLGMALLGGVATAHFLLALATETRRQALWAFAMDECEEEVDE